MRLLIALLVMLADSKIIGTVLRRKIVPELRQLSLVVRADISRLGALYNGTARRWFMAIDLLVIRVSLCLLATPKISRT